MENDEFVSPGVGKWLGVMFACVLAFGGYMAIKQNIDTANKTKQDSVERMYLACLDKLTNPESPHYAAQLESCKKGS